MKAKILPGSLVFSKKGRDKGKPFVVLWRLDAEFVFLADGSLRKADKPKKKKEKHISPSPVCFPEIAELYAQGKLKDSDLRKALWPYRNDQQAVTENGEG